MKNTKKQTKNRSVSKSTSQRLPYYIRTLRQLLEQNIYRISSKTLAERMNLSSPQIRQDLSALGVSGLKGYGYDVRTLYTSMMDIASIRDEYSAVIIGCQPLVHMLTSRPVFIRQGVALKQTFNTDSNENDNILAEFDAYCRSTPPDIIVLATEEPLTTKTLEIIKQINIKGVWNFSDKKLDLDIPVKNIWIDDSLMTLCYEISQNQ
ncbi:MAG: hypothetical protein IKL40_03075 [Clostridia bacterium]|nr:hypothetical protein [Clostridia bacterium]